MAHVASGELYRSWNSIRPLGELPIGKTGTSARMLWTPPPQLPFKTSEILLGN